jgi:hypothetical protein
LPSLPAPQPTYWEILTRYSFSFTNPELSANGLRSWEARGWYLYEQIAPRTVQDGYFSGAVPTDTLSYLQSIYTGVNFITGVLGPTPAPAGLTSPFSQTGAEGLGL